MRETLSNLAIGLALAILVIFLLLSANFQSMRLALVVLSTVPAVICGALFMAVALAFVFPSTPIVVRILLGLLIVFLGIAGDLFESRLKRVADFKDSSALIPGHGGVLDRIDALLFAIPVFYFMVLQGRVA